MDDLSGFPLASNRNVMAAAPIALDYPLSSAGYRAAMEGVRRRQRIALRSLVASSGMSRMEVVRAAEAVGGTGVLDLHILKNLMNGNTVVSAERAHALAGAFGCAPVEVAPHLTAMPWATGGFVSRLAGRPWSEISDHFRAGPRHDVPHDGRRVPPPALVAPAEDDVLMQMRWLGADRMRFVYRGILSRERFELLSKALAGAERGALPGMSGDADMVRVVFDGVVPLSSSVAIQRAIAGPLPRASWWRRLFR